MLASFTHNTTLHTLTYPLIIITVVISMALLFCSLHPSSKLHSSLLILQQQVPHFHVMPLIGLMFLTGERARTHIFTLFFFNFPLQCNQLSDGLIDRGSDTFCFKSQSQLVESISYTQESKRLCRCQESRHYHNHKINIQINLMGEDKESCDRHRSMLSTLGFRELFSIYENIAIWVICYYILRIYISIMFRIELIYI